jgi:hypothetical protein
MEPFRKPARLTGGKKDGIQKTAVPNRRPTDFQQNNGHPVPVAGTGGPKH